MLVLFSQMVPQDAILVIAYIINCHFHSTNHLLSVNLVLIVPVHGHFSPFTLVLICVFSYFFSMVYVRIFK